MILRGEINLPGQSIEVLQNGRKNNIWIGTKSGGLSEYNFETGRIRNYANNNQHVSGFNADYILSILDTDTEKLFIGTWKGFEYLDKKTGQFTILNTHWKTFDIQPDGKIGYWLATNSGLRHINRQLENDASFNFGVKNVNISSIVADEANHCLWLGTWREGIFQFDLQTKKFKNYKNKKGDPSSLSSDNAYRVFLDSKGTVWVGTWGGGLHRFDRNSETFEKVDLAIPGLYTNDNKIILTIHEDLSGLLWIGTDGAGVFKFDLNQKKFFNIGYENKKSSLQGSTHVLSVYVDRYNKLWLGTKGGGIQYAPDWKNFTQIDINAIEKSDPLKLPYESRCFLQEGDSLWVGTNKGLFRILNKGMTIGNFEFFNPDPANKTSISGKKINAMVRDADGKIWIGTQETGLSYLSGYDKNKRPVFKNYLPAYGVKGALQNERVSSLLFDTKKTFVGGHL